MQRKIDKIDGRDVPAPAQELLKSASDIYRVGDGTDRISRQMLEGRLEEEIGAFEDVEGEFEAVEDSFGSTKDYGLDVEAPEDAPERLEKDTVVVRSLRSGPDSLPQVLSRDTYEKGLGVYDTEQIPCGIDNLHIDKIAAIFAERIVARGSDDPVVVYEIGAGHGLDGLRFLDKLKETHPEVYAKTLLIETDVSKHALEDTMRAGIFDEHQGHVEFQRMDAGNPAFEVPPTMVLAKNVLSSLPVYRIGIGKSEKGELEVKEMKTGANVIGKRPLVKINTSTGLADTVPTESIEPRPLLNQLEDPATRFELTPQICARTTYWHGMTPFDERKLHFTDGPGYTEFVEGLPKGAIYNYSAEVERLIRTTLESLAPDGFAVVTDYMHTDKGKFLRQASKVGHYGTVTAHTVEGWRLKEIAESEKVHVHATELPEAGRQSLFFDTAKSKDMRAKMAEAIGRDAGLENVESQVFFEEVDDIILSFDEKTLEGDITEHIDKAFEKLSEATKRDYRLLSFTANLLGKKQHYKASLKYATASVEIAPHLSVTGYTEIALARHALDDPVGVEEALDAAYEIAPYNPQIHRLRMEFYRAQKRWPELVTSTMDFLADERGLTKHETVEALIELCSAQEQVSKMRSRDHSPYKVFREMDITSQSTAKDRDFPPYNYEVNFSTEEAALPTFMMERIKAWEMARAAEQVTLKIMDENEDYWERQRVISVLREIRTRVALPGARSQWPDAAHGSSRKQFVWTAGQSLRRDNKPQTRRERMRRSLLDQ